MSRVNPMLVMSLSEPETLSKRMTQNQPPSIMWCSVPSYRLRMTGRALSRYCDYLPQLRKIDRELARRLAEGSFGR
jgi:hypothetical protein